MNKIIIMLIGILLICASFTFGLFMREGNKGIVLAEAKQLNELLDSSIVQSITYALSGEILAIDGRILTLGKDGGASFSAEIKEDSKINLITVKRIETGFSSSVDPITIESIKVGDNATIICQGFASDGFIFGINSVNVIVEE